DKAPTDTWQQKLDFRDADAYRSAVTKFSPDALFHLGAYTSLEYCESNERDAYLTNLSSVETAVLIANDLNIPLLYISTAGIFDGQQSSYDDWDLPNPLGVYARTKYLAERYVVENCKKYFVCRAGWMMGGGPRKDKKFVNKLAQQIYKGSSVLHVVNDKDGTPTYTLEFANTVKELLATERWGVYNMVCGGQTSRLDVAEEMLRILGLENKVELRPVSSTYFDDEYFAPRPASERLINSKLELLGINKMSDWRVSLKSYLTVHYQDLFSDRHK
ncbi:sugar nucleotide-binding protein, partial [Luminiphilus sp.]|nr:sugar nucleotide-binding protein [Luminiphilus sp.]